ncbi:MAG TPA: DUF4870 domain-containing protein [Anaerolineae bacterium]|nr:DUF4870 domain-containing protein [Anaerolineae bacterium]HOQ99776.1 DUF4870 domain-containing protein [Anaerolineae bacterium]HPL30207.1 DUF4870 domain-containing protein [Anaerolineae bacterium]
MNTASNQAMPGDVTSNDRLWAALAYFPNLVILPILILVMEENKTRAFQRYHAIQALGMLAVAVVYGVVIGLLQCVLGFALGAVNAGLISTALSCLMTLLSFVPAAAMLYFAYQAYTGKIFEIPVLTQFLRQQKWL